MKDDNVARCQFWDFLKNFGLLGGLRLSTFGAQLTSLHKIVSHPLSSARVCSTPAVTPPAQP